MSFWKPLIDWNASHKHHAANRTEAKWGIGIGILKPAEADAVRQGKRPEDLLPIAVLPVVSPGDIHGAF